MTNTSVATVYSKFRPAARTESASPAINSLRSTSIIASTRSSTSRLTLVEDVPEMTVNDKLAISAPEKVTTQPSSKYSWIDHVIRVFCSNPSRTKQSMLDKEHVQHITLDSEKFQNDKNWPSPYILPVHVLSNHQGSDKHPITKLAKCTIDTGNLQGNIVSRYFVEKVLQFDPSSFLSLTKEEEIGGTSITGDSHIPVGAINLTWYHQNSTRVFRDVRFLISPIENCDMIIGARSIRKDKILDVPFLGINGGNKIYVSEDDAAKEKKNLKDLRFKKDTELGDKEIRRKELLKEKKRGKKDSKNELPGLNEGILHLRDEVDILDWTIRLYEIAYEPIPAEKSKGGDDKIADRKVLADEFWEKLRVSHVSDELSESLEPHWESIRVKLGYKETFIPSTDVEAFTSGFNAGAVE